MLCTRTVLFADISMYVSMLCHVMYVSISCYVRFYVRVYLQRNSNIERRAVSSFHSGAVSNVDHSPAHWQTGAAGGPIAGCRIHTQIQPLRFSNHFQDWQSGAMCKAHGSINKHLQTRGKYKLLHLSAYILYIYISNKTLETGLDWTCRNLVQQGVIILMGRDRPRCTIHWPLTLTCSIHTGNRQCHAQKQE